MKYKDNNIETLTISKKAVLDRLYKDKSPAKNVERVDDPKEKSEEDK
jgi:hypothetical protein